MEYLLQIVHAVVSPVNCIGNLGVDVLHALGSFAQCVGHNLSVSAAGAMNTSSDVVATVASTVGSVGA